MLFILSVILGALAGRLAGGSLWNVSRLRFRWPLLVLAALLIKEAAVVVTPLAVLPVSAYAYVASLGILVGWILWHRDTLPGAWLVAAGMAGNLVAIGVNGGHMPISEALVRHAPPQLANRLLQDGVLGQYALASGSTHLNWLGDWISLPGLVGVVFPQAYSPGDLLALLGLVAVGFMAVRPLGSGMRVDVFRSEWGLMLETSLPGFGPDEVAVEVGPKIIRVRADRSDSTPPGVLLRHERWHGERERTVRLPVRVDPTGASAVMRDGVLTVSVPLASADALHAVPITTAAPPTDTTPAAVDAARDHSSESHPGTASETVRNLSLGANSGKSRKSRLEPSTKPRSSDFSDGGLTEWELEFSDSTQVREGAESRDPDV